MKNNEKQFYLVDFQVLPEAIKKTKQRPRVRPYF